MPRWRWLFGGTALRVIFHHLHFPAEVTRQHCREFIILVSDLSAGWNAVHLRLRFQLGVNTFLITEAIVKSQGFFSAEAFVGADDLEVKVALIRNEHTQLDRLFVLFMVAGTNEDKPLFSLLTIGLPLHIEIVAGPILEADPRNAMGFVI